MQGLTVEATGSAVAFSRIIEISLHPRPYLSIEPINGGLWREVPSKIELIIVGAETGNRKGKVIPQKEWLQSIIDHVPKEKIYWKNNIKPYLEKYGL
jgi:protein gp37